MESSKCRKQSFQASLDATWLPCSLPYSQIGQQKSMEQSRKRYGSRISILGLWQAGKSFEYGLAQGGFNSKSYIKVMDWVAQKAEQRGLGGFPHERLFQEAACLFSKTGKLTVIVQDNSLIHKSYEARACWSRWSEQGLLLFFLPAYCSDMNPIETQWHQLKAHEIAGRIFDNEYDLAMTVIQGMQNRSEVSDYYLERFIFNSA